MDCWLSAKIRAVVEDAVVEDLAREHQKELADAGTLVDLEELTCQIGDEVARQLCEHELIGRAEQARREEIVKCPECGEPCMAGQPEPTVLEGLRGELAYSQPSYYCRHCRRSFFSRWRRPWACRHGAPSRRPFCGRWFGREVA